MPLWRPEDLLVAGMPVVVSGVMPVEADSHDPGGWDRNGGSAGGHVPYGSQGTDLVELDRLGMSIALSFESNRLGRAGETASVFSAASPSVDARVFDTSSPAAIKLAMAASPRLRAAFAALAPHGIRPEWPGFDILTLSAIGDLPDRMIELKSSGVHATVQSMSWNEWKSARGSQMRERFWLYLAGNLRSDLAAARPFVQAIRDPFGSLLNTLVTGPVRRSVQLDLRSFEHADLLELTFRADAARGVPDPT